VAVVGAFVGVAAGDDDAVGDVEVGAVGDVEVGAVGDVEVGEAGGIGGVTLKGCSARTPEVADPMAGS
jgi:hypothetical protein